MAASAETDAQLVEAAAAGDTTAFETLMRRHLDAVYGHAFRFFGERQAAEDATQEVFVKVFRSLGSFDGRSAFSTWLFRVTRNVCLDLLRRGRHRPVPVDPLDLAATAAEGPEGVIASVDLERACLALSPEDRDAFNAVALFALSYREAGAVLGVAEGTVKSRVYRARRTLATALGLGATGGA